MCISAFVFLCILRVLSHYFHKFIKVNWTGTIGVNLKRNFVKEISKNLSSSFSLTSKTNVNPFCPLITNSFVCVVCLCKDNGAIYGDKKCWQSTIIAKDDNWWQLTLEKLTSLMIPSNSSSEKVSSISLRMICKGLVKNERYNRGFYSKHHFWKTAISSNFNLSLLSLFLPCSKCISDNISP